MPELDISALINGGGLLGFAFIVYRQLEKVAATLERLGERLAKMEERRESQAKSS